MLLTDVSSVHFALSRIFNPVVELARCMNKLTPGDKVRLSGKTRKSCGIFAFKVNASMTVPPVATVVSCAVQ